MGPVGCNRVSKRREEDMSTASGRAMVAVPAPVPQVIFSDARKVV